MPMRYATQVKRGLHERGAALDRLLHDCNNAAMLLRRVQTTAAVLKEESMHRHALLALSEAYDIAVAIEEAIRIEEAAEIDRQANERIAAIEAELAGV